MTNLIITSASDDGYLHLLLEMIESLGADNLQKHALGIFDLGLSESGKKQILKLKPDAIIKKPEWKINAPPAFRNVFNLATSSRPFMREHFPGYDTYMHIDADIWLMDPTAVDDFLEAVESTGFAIQQDGYPIRPTQLKVRHMKIFGKVFVYGVKANIYHLMKLYFGEDDPKYFSKVHMVGCGIMCMKANSPVWEKWQEAMHSINYKRIGVKRLVCDQACLLYALVMHDLPYTIMSPHYNWMPEPDGYSTPLFDTGNKILVDSVYPHAPIKVMHVGGGANPEFSIPTTDGGTIKTKVTRAEFLKAVEKF